MTNEELTKRVVDIDERLVRQEEHIKNITDRMNNIDTLTDSVHKMATSLEVLTNTQKSTEKKLDGLSKDVEEIKEKPAKNWENTVRTVLELVLAAVVTFVLVKMGLK